MKITEITRNALLDHATDVFAELGYEGASVREITRRAMANQASINYHFGGKEALYREILRLAIAALSDESPLDDDTMGNMSRDEAVRLFIRQQVTPLLKHGQISRYLRILAWETLAPTAAYSKFIASEKLPILDQAEKIVRRFLPETARPGGNCRRDDLADGAGDPLHPSLRHAVKTAHEPEDRQAFHREAGHGSRPHGGCRAQRPRHFQHRAVERFPIRWNHLIEKKSLKIKELEHVLIEKVDQLFRNML